MKTTTKRLVIRDMTALDYPQFEPTLNEAQKSAFGSGRGFFDWLISQYSNMDIINGLISFGMFDRETGNLIGTVGVGRHDDLHEPEIFYFVLTEYRGQGFATEAAEAVTQWALANYEIPYIIGTVGVDNPASQRVLENCGYEYVDTRTLVVHVLNQSFSFKYYRRYKQ